MNALAPAASETRARILTEAERLFRHYGYAKTTVADIAEACGMSSANVYRFFASKSAITEAICDKMLADLEGHLHRIASSDAPASQRLKEFVIFVARFTLETLLDQKKVHEMVVAAMEEHWGAIQRHLTLKTAMIEEIIASGIASGEFKPQDPKRAARCVHNALAAHGHPVLVAQCMDDPNRASPEEMVEFMLSALKA